MNVESEHLTEIERAKETPALRPYQCPVALADPLMELKRDVANRRFQHALDERLQSLLEDRQ